MATIAPYGIYQAFDDNGDPLSGGFLYTYEAGTTTPKATYTTADGDIQNSNPVELDASGQANVWLGDGGYKFILKDADLNTIFTTDDIGGSSNAAFGGEVNLISTNTAITSVYANSVNICTASPTLSLLPVVSAGEGFYFCVKNQGSGTVTIDPDAGELIDGASTKTIGAGLSALIICSGTTWYTLFLQPSGVSFTQTEDFAGLIAAPVDGSYTIWLKASYGGTIAETTTKCVSGTATFTFKINSTALGGTANAVSSAEQSQAHTTNNVFVAGDDIVITVSANATCLKASFNIKFTRTLV